MIIRLNDELGSRKNVRVTSELQLLPCFCLHLRLPCTLKLHPHPQEQLLLLLLLPVHLFCKRKGDFACDIVAQLAATLRNHSTAP